MATVTQTITSLITRHNLERPPEPYVGSMPLAMLRAGVTDELTAKGAGDIGVYSTSTTLPPNFAYRLVELRLQLSAVSFTDLANFESGMEFVIVENQVTTKRFLAFNNPTFRFPSSQLAGYQTRNPAITNDFTTEYSIANPAGLGTDLINAFSGPGILQGTFVDSDGVNATAAIGTVFLARFLVYTVAQFNAGAIWTPAPVVS